MTHDTSTLGRRTDRPAPHAFARICFAGPFSGSGKTTVTLAAIAALTRRGYAVQPYKVGPDYIDTAYQAYAAGRPAGNLDSFLSGKAALTCSLLADKDGADLAVIEGCMGLFDGVGNTSQASTAEVAKLTDTPVVLVIPAKGYAASAAALVLGYRTFDPALNLVGFIVSGPSTKRHADLIAQAVLERNPIAYLGYLPQNEEFSLPSRQLGLVPHAEIEGKERLVKALATQAEQTVDLDALVSLAHTAPPLAQPAPQAAPPAPQAAPPTPRPVIAIAQDEAFCFYYRSSLQELERAGATLVPFSPLNDTALPNHTSGIYLGGGYPEVFAQRLQQNEAMRSLIARASRQGMPLYAECGGYLYLLSSLSDKDGASFEMCNVFEGHAALGTRLNARFGYVLATATRDTFLFAKGQTVHAHEFHHSAIEGEGTLFSVKKASSDKTWFTGECIRNTVATYAHIDFGANSACARAFVAAAREFAQGRSHG